MPTETILSELIERHGIRKSWIAERIGVNRLHFYSVCSGQRKLTTDVAKRCADAMRLDVVERAALMSCAVPDGRRKHKESKTLLEVFTRQSDDDPIVD